MSTSVGRFTGLSGLLASASAGHQVGRDEIKHRRLGLFRAGKCNSIGGNGLPVGIVQRPHRERNGNHRAWHRGGDEGQNSDNATSEAGAGGNAKSR